MVQFLNIYDVFISYRRSDGFIIAEALYKYLTSKGLRVFFDKHEMIDGHYFTTQIATNLKIAPNYILVATDNVFKFRENEDWVCKEIEVAIEEYESNPVERTLTVLVPESVTFPEKVNLPKSVRNIADAQRITLLYGEDFAEPFYKALKAVTNINRRNLWFAAHRWLENSKQPGGRFASLNINEGILPKASKNKTEQKAMPINVYSKDEENKNRQSLFEAMSCNGNHFYLIGQGGIGKTTALMHIMNNAYVDKQYSEKTQIPLFVELSFAPDTYGALYEGGKSSFIRRSIYKQVRTDRTIKQITAKEVSDVDEVFSSLPYDVAVQPITDILSKTTPAPEYLLLLDGLNEVSSVTIEETGLSVVQMIMREIDLLISECPNVRVVLTSRSDESSIYNESISRLYLSGVEDSTIKDYLEGYELSKEQIDKVLEDNNLCETLQIPLFLTMYAFLSEYDEVSTQGEILKLFFNERRKNISVYTMQERLVQLEKNITDVASAVQKNRIDADMQNFILDFILPEIAWRMEKSNDFYIRIREIKKIVESVLKDTNDLSVCGEFGREIFSKYRNGASAKMHTYKVAKRIVERLGDDITEVTESIINCCVFAFGIMQESNGKYGFVHQHIRDYFAALKNINTIRLAVYLHEEGEKELALECMNKAFKDEPVNYTVRRFMGEYLGEHLNKPYYANGKWNYGVPTDKCDRNLMSRALDIYRGCFKAECGFGIYLLIQIFKEIRKDLSGANLSNIDFQNVSLNGVFCSRGDLSVNLTNSKINAGNIFSQEHYGEIRTVNISKDSKYIVTTSDDRKIKIWEFKTLRCIYSLFIEEGVSAASFSIDNNTIVFATDDGFVKLLDVKKQCCRDLLKNNIPYITNVEYSPEGRYIIIKTMFDGTRFLASDTLREVFLEDNLEYNEIIFSNNDKYIATISGHHLLQIWDAKTLKKISEYEDDDKSLVKVYFSSNCEFLILTHGDRTISVFYSKNLNLKFMLGEQEGWILDVFWEIENKYIIVVADDMRIWNVVSLKCEKSINGQRWALLSPNKKYIITSDYAGLIKIWNADDLTLINTIKHNLLFGQGAPELKCSLNGQYLIAYNSTAIVLIDLNDFSCVGKLTMHIKDVRSVCYTPNGDNILTLSSDGTLKIWDAKKYIVKFIVHDGIGDVYSLSTNYQNNNLIVKYNHGKVKVWCQEKECVIEEFVESFGGWSLREYSPDGKYILVPSGYGIDILSTIDMAPIGVMAKECLSSVELIRYSPDGKSIITVHCDGKALKWDTKNFSKCIEISGHYDDVNTVHFDTNGSFFITGSKDGTTKVWRANDNKNVYTLYDEFGLYIRGVDFSVIDSTSYFSDDEKVILRQYGAIID